MGGVGSAKWDWQKFLECERPKKRFGELFRAAYGKLVVTPAAPAADPNQEDAEESLKKAEADRKGQAAGSASQKESTFNAFRKDCEAYVDRELDARTVILTNDGTHDELHNAVTGNRLYQNLGPSGARFMGFYDVKNAHLVEVYEGEALTQREPLLDEDKFKIFLNIMHGLMKEGEDVCWILCGRAEQNYEKITKELRVQAGLRFKVFVLIYDTRLLSKWYWKRMRGLANSRNIEKAIFVWKGKLPKGLPKERRYVDAGSCLYNEVLLRVPVVHPKFLAFVDKGVREESLRTMAGLPLNTLPEGAAPDGAAPAPVQTAELIKHVKKRRLYRQSTGEEVVWFPHDNAPALLKELVHECGRQDTPGKEETRWVFYGTPGGSAGVQGVLEMGCSVVALCEDTHHATHFKKHLRQRCVEALLSGSLVFADQDLTDRASKLWPEKKEKEKEETDKEDKKDKKDKKKKEDDKPKNKRNKGKTSRKRKRSSSGSSSSSSSSSSSTSSAARKEEKKG